MSIGNFSPLAASLAGAHLAERNSGSVERQSADAKAHDRKVDSQTKAVEAQGFGNSKESEASSADRDADGRQAWQWSQHRQRQKEDEHRIRDLSGQTGQTLDLDG